MRHVHAHHHVVHHRSVSPAGRFLSEPGAGPLRVVDAVAHHAVALAPLLLVGLVALVVVFVRRVWGRHRLAAEGSWFELRLGEEVSRESLGSFTATLASGLPRRVLSASPWVALSLSSEEDRATCALFVSGGLSSAQIRASVEHALLGAVTVERPAALIPDVARGARCLRVAGIAPVGSRFLPLRVDHRVDPSGQMLAALRAQEPGEGGVVQLVLQAPARGEARRARAQAARLRSGGGMQPGRGLAVLDGIGSVLAGAMDALSPGSPQPTRQPRSRQSADPFSQERARAIDAKANALLLAGTLRVGSWAQGRRRSGARLGGVVAALGQFHDLGGLRRGWEPFCAGRLAACLPSVKPRLLLSSGEAAALIVVPERSALAPISFAEAPSRRVAPVAQAPSRGLLLGRSDRSGFDRDIRVEPRALLQHTHILGPTGRGKSTLLLNMTVETMRAGMGGIVLDPTGELTGNILARIPTERAQDVDLLDLGDERFPPALNLLAYPPGGGDAQAQAICNIFARLFARFWGPRTEDIFRSALMTLLSGGGPAGEPPTLADVLMLLSDPSERSRYHVSDPVAVGMFWEQWQALSEAARVNALGPLSNKLRALLGNRMLRDMLCQPAAPDLTQTIDKGRWLVVSLPQTLGEDAADLIGSVLLHRAWQAARGLGPIAHSTRPPFLCVVDECHRFCNLPQGMADTLAQARGFGLGLVLAHQHLAQLSDRELGEAIDANCQTKLCFALQAADAKRMAAHFQPRLDAYDLQHLPSYGIACRILQEAHELPAATATTLPPPAPTPGDPASVIRARARSKAGERDAVEAMIRARYGRIEQPPAGRAQADETPSNNGTLPGAGGAPLDAPQGAPSDGAPPPPVTPHQHSDLWPQANPDSYTYPFTDAGGPL